MMSSILGGTDHTEFTGVNAAHCFAGAGGAEDQKPSHWLMFQRVGWQALAFVFILLALLVNLK